MFVKLNKSNIVSDLCCETKERFLVINQLLLVVALPSTTTYTVEPNYTRNSRNSLFVFSMSTIFFQRFVESEKKTVKRPINLFSQLLFCVLFCSLHFRWFNFADRMFNQENFLQTRRNEVDRILITYETSHLIPNASAAFFFSFWLQRITKHWSRGTLFMLETFQALHIKLASLIYRYVKLQRS